MESGRLVCDPCNNRRLSNVDEELTRHSYLAMVASQEIDSTLWQIWNSEDEANKLLIEARPSWYGPLLAKLVNYPQIVFEPSGPQIRGDVEEMQQFGIEDYRKVLLKAARRAIVEHGNGIGDAIKFDAVQPSILERGYRLAPRLFARRTIKQIAKKVHKEPMRLRYVTNADRRFALRMLSRIDDWPELNQFRVGEPSPMPAVATFCDAVKTMRTDETRVQPYCAYCKNTDVNSRTYKGVIQVIKGNRRMLRKSSPEMDSFMQKTFNQLPINPPFDWSIATAARWAMRRMVVYMSFFGGNRHRCYSGPRMRNGTRWMLLHRLIRRSGRRRKHQCFINRFASVWNGRCAERHAVFSIDIRREQVDDKSGSLETRRIRWIAINTPWLHAFGATWTSRKDSTANACQ